MRYVRTKDGIYVVVREKQEKLVVRTRNADFEPNFTILKKYIIKSADTIKELCDELVLIEEDYPTILEELDFKGKTYLRRNEYEFLRKLPEKPIIYGAIWTDKGLIYVAKMKGVLPNGEIDWQLL